MQKNKSGSIELGKWLRGRRETRGLTQDEVAKALGYQKADTYGAFERGKALPDGEDAVNLKRTLKLTPTEWKNFIKIYMKLGQSEENALALKLVQAADPAMPGGDFPRLVGSAAALIYCWELLRMNPRFDPPTWKWEYLLGDLEHSVQETGSIDWAHTPNFLMWAAGYFRNKTQSNAITVFERCLDQWLSNKRGVDAGTTYNYEREFTESDFSEIREKLSRLNESVLDSATHERILHLANSFGNYQIQQEAVNRMQQLADICARNFPRDVAMEILYEELPISEADSTSLMFWRSKPRDDSGKSGSFYHAEWVVTAKALICIGDFRRKMLADSSGVKSPG